MRGKSEGRKKRNARRGFIAAALCVVFAAALLATGCGKSAADDKESGKESGGSTSKGSSGKKTEVMIWARYGSDGLADMKNIAAAFNESQDKYEAKAINQGGPSDIRRKMMSLDKKDYPAIICGTPFGTPYYDSVDYVKPLQDYLDKDDDDWENAIYPSVRTAYSNAEGRLVGMPLGLSSAGYYVNLDMLEKGGYSLSDVTSFEKMCKIAEDLVSKKIVKYGVAFINTGVGLQNLLTLQGVDMFDNDNGYGGAPTKSLLMEGETYKELQKIVAIVKSATKAGAVSPGGDNAAIFASQEVAFSGVTNSYHRAMATAGITGFKHSFLPCQGIDDNAKYKNCSLIEGTGLFLVNSGDEDAMQGAYEFMKFYGKSAKAQAKWNVARTYVSFTDIAAAEPEYSDFVTKNTPWVTEQAKQLQNPPAGLRLPYNLCPDDIENFSNKLFEYVRTKPDADIDAYIKEQVADVDKAVKVAQVRQSHRQKK